MLGHDCSDECVIYKWDKLCLKKKSFLFHYKYSILIGKIDTFKKRKREMYKRK